MTQAEGFEILEHPADMGFLAWAENLPRLFAVSAQALTSILVDLNSIDKTDSTEISLEADDLDTLLFKWLSEILYQFDAEMRLFSEFEVHDLDLLSKTFSLKAKAKGEPYRLNKHQVKTYIKAITFHQFKIESQPFGYSAQIYLDI